MLTNKPEAKADLNDHPHPKGSEAPNPAPDATIPVANVNLTKPVAATVQRRAASLPKRAPDSTWSVIKDACVQLLEARGYQRADDVQKAFEQLRPVGRLALTMHSLEGGSVTLGTEDLQFDIEIVYGMAYVEDLSLPSVVNALDVLPQETICTLTLNLTSLLQDAATDRIIAEINAADALNVQLELIETEQAPHTDSEDIADNNPDSQEEETQNGKD